MRRRYFITWLNSDPEAVAILIKEAGIYPAATVGASDPFLRAPLEFYGGEKIFDVFAEAAKQVNNDFVWGPTMTDTYRFLADGITAALGGTATEESHLNELAKAIADRGDSLQDLVGREMHQFDRLMAQKEASA